MTAVNQTIANYAAMLKEYYSYKNVSDAVLKDSILLQLIAKRKMGGKQVPIPIKTSNVQGGSATFATAQSNITQILYSQFLLTHAKDYALARIEGDLLDAANVDAGAFMRASTAIIDSSRDCLRESMSNAVFLDGTGVIGAVGAIASSVVTLSQESDIAHFEVGMVVSVYDVTLATLRGSVAVTAIDEDLYKVTLASTPGGTVATDVLIRQGDLNLKMKGLAAWIPSSAPSSTAFFGVDRSTNPTRLGGRRYTATGTPIEEALITAKNRLGRYATYPDLCVMSHTKMGDLEKSLGDRKRYGEAKSADGKIGFEVLQIQGNKGPISILADAKCPDNRIYLLTQDSWALHHYGSDIAFFDEMAGGMLKQRPDEDAYEVRIKSYAQLACDAPGQNMVIIHNS